MRIKKNGEIIVLTESDLKRIVNHSENLNEGVKSFLRKNIGSKIKGIKGLFSGKGYNISKYSYQLSGAINELNEELIETKNELKNMINEIYEVNMESEDWQKLNDHIESAIDIYDDAIGINELIMGDLDVVAKESESQKERDKNK